MRILLLNQAFHPDVVSTGQHATDLAVELAACGHEMTVISSRRAYDHPALRFAPRETWRGIRIIRIPIFGLGKSSRARRAADFAAFFANCMARVLLLPRFDVVIALTSPPLLSALAASLVRIKGGKFVFWSMDLNPDEAIAAGWIRAGSLPARILSAVLDHSLHSADLVIALDRFMQQRLLDKGVPNSRIAVIAPWAHEEVQYDAAAGGEFRKQHGLDGKFVVMYSGNHSPCHPLDAVLEAARLLRSEPLIRFCFIGGGSEFPKVSAFAAAHRLDNILCLPYQPRQTLSASLSAADLHVVAMGDPFVGIVHPCKVYNIRSLGIPYIYIGPAPSHVTELSPAAEFRHGDAEGIREFILRAARQPSRFEPASGVDAHSQNCLLARMVERIEACADARAKSVIPSRNRKGAVL
jgi:glycosyltransferase involved in cell wall biosynthesis